jgi:hypothetical protein
MKSLRPPGWKLRLFPPCLAVVLAMRVGLNLIKFDRLRRHVAALGADGQADPETLRRVAWGVSRAARLVPRASCLTQALAGQYVLARMGFASRIRFGVERTSGDEMRAHAWLLSGETVVLGGVAGGMGGYHQLADFG